MGPFWDTAITVSALFLGLLCLAFALNASVESGEVQLGWLFIGSGYFLGGLLNAYLSALWKRPELAFWARLAVIILKPLVLLFLIVAVAVAFLVVLAWVLLPKPWAS
jgi:hypothetical protein